MKPAHPHQWPVPAGRCERNWCLLLEGLGNKDENEGGSQVTHVAQRAVKALSHMDNISA